MLIERIDNHRPAMRKTFFNILAVCNIFLGAECEKHNKIFIPHIIVHRFIHSIAYYNMKTRKQYVKNYLHDGENLRLFSHLEV